MYPDRDSCHRTLHRGTDVSAPLPIKATIPTHEGEAKKKITSVVKVPGYWACGEGEAGGGCSEAGPALVQL